MTKLSLLILSALLRLWKIIQHCPTNLKDVIKRPVVCHVLITITALAAV